MFETVGLRDGMLSDIAAQVALLAMLVVSGTCAAGTAVEAMLALASVPVEIEVVQAPREVTWALANSEREQRE